MSKAQRIAAVLFAAGLIIRVALMATPSGNDVMSYAKWGQNVYSQGLAESFDGVYFPIQYLILSTGHFFSTHLGVSFDTVNKVFNLIFEIGLLALVISLTKKSLQAWKSMALYWLNPLTLIMFQQGYIDAQFSFFVVLAVWILLRRLSPARAYLLASLSLGTALLMKPQAIPILITLGILGTVLLFSRDRDWKKMLVLFSMPALLLGVFSAYFGFALSMEGHKTLSAISERVQGLGVSDTLSDFIAGSSFLPAHYAHVPDIMPAVNANMPGPWFFIAQPLRVNDQSIYRVSDKTSLGGVSFRTLGLALFLVVIFFFAYKIGRSNRSVEERIALIMLIVPFLVPYLTTSAHESHFYLGFATTLILGAWLNDRRIIYAVYVLGILNGLNLLCLYILPKYAHIPYGIATQSGITLVSTTLFIFVLWRLTRAFGRSMPPTLHHA